MPGLFDLIDAMQRVATTPPNMNADIDPSNPGVQRNSRTIGSFLGDVVRSADNRMTSIEAANVGLPEAEGMSREDISLMLKQREVPQERRLKEAEIGEKEAVASKRKAEAERTGAGKDDEDRLLEIASNNVNKLMNENRTLAFKFSKDPEAKEDMIREEFETLKRVRLGKRKPATRAGAGTAKAGGAKIRVRRKSDGETGTIVESDFDDKKYEKI